MWLLQNSSENSRDRKGRAEGIRAIQGGRQVKRGVGGNDKAGMGKKANGQQCRCRVHGRYLDFCISFSEGLRSFQNNVGTQNQKENKRSRELKKMTECSGQHMGFVGSDLLVGTW